jgi:hypothetical protein
VVPMSIINSEFICLAGHFKRVSDFGWLWIYGRLKLGIKGVDC